MRKDRFQRQYFSMYTKHGKLAPCDKAKRNPVKHEEGLNHALTVHVTGIDGQHSRAHKGLCQQQCLEVLSEELQCSLLRTLYRRFPGMSLLSLQK
eukprot:m.369303 g.369303  ORF g.369303 m.369303 type:complete len:95 (-) comp56116_c0_seq1:828-1112(-)